MLPAANRLTRQADFQRVVRSGHRAGSATLVVHLVLPARSAADLAPVEEGGIAPENGDASRAGFVVSRAVGNSVVRHRVQRRLRELVRERLTRLPRGSALVVRALPPATRAPYARMGAELDRCLERLLDGWSDDPERAVG